jgi:hypothetical protein
MKKYFSVLFFLVFLVLFSSTTVSAQTSSSVFQNDLIISRSPSIPSPGETVTFKVESYTTDLVRSVIMWGLNGIVQKKGYGETSFSITTPAAGMGSLIDVFVLKPNGEELRETFLLFPVDIDIIQEPFTYVPPFYKGRSLFSNESAVKVAVIPNFVQNNQKIKPSDILFTWEKDGFILSDISGIGKDNAIFLGDSLVQPFLVSVTAETIDGDLKAKDSISIKPIDPKVLVYEKDPINGILFSKSLTRNVTVDKEEFGVVAIPYFFSTDSRNSNYLEYLWKENGSTINDPTLSSEIVFMNEGLKNFGTSDIFVEIEHVDNLLQIANAYLNFKIVGSGGDLINISDETEIF